MIEEVARVISVEQDEAIVEVAKTSSCGSCHARGACGTSSLAGFFNFKSPALSVKNTLNAKAGDNVLLVLPEQTLLAGSFLLYIVPLLLMIGFASLASLLLHGDGEGVQIISGVLGLLLGLYLSRKLSVAFLRPDDSARMVKVYPRQVLVTPEHLVS